MNEWKTGLPGRKMTGRKSVSIAIAGGGASAALVLANLSRHKERGKISDISIYDESGCFAKGIAYGTKNPMHLLNVRAMNMGALENDPKIFPEWLKKNKHPYGELDFVPRAIYAEYLKELWDDAIKCLQDEGCDIQLKREPFKKGQANVVVMATGNANAYALLGAEKLSEKDGYHSDPWNIDYQSVQGDVVITGTGLSMVDTVTALHAAGFKGRITAISRNGLLPAVHVSPATYPPFFDKEFPKTALALLREIRAHVHEAQKKNIPWQAVIDSMRLDTNKIWLALNEAEKRKIKRFSAFWKIHRHRMAPEAARVVHDLIKSGALKIVKDRIEKIEPGLLVQGRKSVYKAAHVINCLGYGADKNFAYKSCMEKEGIFALGPALQGYYFETTAMPEIRAQAHRIANEILSS